MLQNQGGPTKFTSTNPSTWSEHFTIFINHWFQRGGSLFSPYRLVIGKECERGSPLVVPRKVNFNTKMRSPRSVLQKTTVYCRNLTFEISNVYQSSGVSFKRGSVDEVRCILSSDTVGCKNISGLEPLLTCMDTDALILRVAFLLHLGLHPNTVLCVFCARYCRLALVEPIFEATCTET
jgi:hypothetical protein